MSLTIGQKVQAEKSNCDYVIKKKLGEGGQGAVFLVEGPTGPMALKWYNQIQSKPDQRKAIEYLIGEPPPKGIAGKRFIWPQDIATEHGTDRFGYLMALIETNRFAELGDIQAKKKQVPDYPTLAEISFQIANSYRALHLSGHCYRDISRGNVLFDPKTGEVLICDNDNIGIDNQGSCAIWGTWEYIAPELITDKSKNPSTKTDLHSLAVLLFNLWMWHHPLHGKMEYDIHSWDLFAKKKVYGASPVFVFDPSDSSNRLPDEYKTCRKKWDACPSEIKNLFTKAFTVGLKDPGSRVTEGEWQEAFLRLKDGAISCQKCKAACLWESSKTNFTCWYCNSLVHLPPKLQISRTNGAHQILLGKDIRILQIHLDSKFDKDDSQNIIGQVVQNPTNPNIWGIRNLSKSNWVATFVDGKTLEILPQQAVPMADGLKLNIGNSIAIIKA